MADETGIIVKIKCRYFLTYDSIEAFPKNKLNVIIGPNGTGKSALACAIVLGLGGKPSILGRSKQLGAFVQHGQTKSMIEIVLKNANGENYVIKRVFDIKNESKWSLNGKHKNESQIKTLVSELNIQIDNLCQFLPQDRVQDFAKMNKQQLFYNTLKSIGGVEMETTVDKLKQLQKNYESVKKEIDSKSKVLEQNVVDNQRLEGEVQNSHTRNKIMDAMELMNQKKLWLTYDQKCKEKDGLKNELDAISMKYNDAKNKVKPMEAKIKEISTHVIEIQNKITPLNNTLQQNISMFRKYREECNTVKNENELVQDRIDNLHDEERTILEEIESKKTLIRKAQGGLEIDDTQLISEKQELELKINELRDSDRKIKNSKSQVEDNLEGIERQIANTTRRLKQLDNVLFQREELLSRISEDAMKATQWLRENQNLFHGKIYEPMLLEINITKPEYKRHIESIISRDDLLAFSCENAQDTAILLRELREKKKLRVNIVTLPDTNKRQSIARQPYPIEELQQFGFNCYASDVIEVNDGIKSYLDLAYGMRAIPLGGAQVKVHHYKSNIPKGIKKYFSDENQYNVYVSSYSGDIVSKTFPLKRKEDYFTTSVDPEKIRQLKINIEQLRNQEAGQREHKNTFDLQLEDIRQKFDDMRQQYQTVNKALEQKKQSQTRILSFKKSKEDLEKSLNEHRNKHSHLKNQKVANASKLTGLSEKLVQYLSAYIASNEKVELIKLRLNDERDIKQTLESDFSESKKSLVRLEKLVDESKERLNLKKQEAKRIYKEASERSGGVLPSDEPLRSKLNKFSNNLDGLETEISKQKAELACLPEVDQRIFQEFENRQKKIESLQQSMDELSSQLEATESSIETISSTWFPQINEYVNEINRKFSVFFKEMGCAGEVSLFVPENKFDFDNYGIVVKVKFRDESELKELDGHRQSGGERAVSTALYMLSMQGLSSAPFRLVDEINQGMDAVNERRVFQLLLSIVEHSTTACQYFLITPKLLQDLEYTGGTNIMCIYSGPNCLSYHQFNIQDLENKARLLYSGEGSEENEEIEGEQ